MSSIQTKEPELKNLKVLYGLFVFMFFTDILMPQYFGIHLGYDITCTRLSNMLFIVYMILNPKIMTHFGVTIARCPITYPMLLYLMVAGYTMVLRVDVNAFFLVFFEMFSLWMLIYGIRYVIGYQRAIRWTVICAYILSLYGLVEFVLGFSPMIRFLCTLPARVYEAYRSGRYRIMGPCGHSLGYGLLLLLFIAVASIDEKKGKVYLFQRPVLLVLLMLNVFLTGSRSTLGIMVVECALILLFTKRTELKKSIMMIFVCIVGLALFMLLFYRTTVGQYIMMQVTSLVDEVLETDYSLAYGADVETLQLSEEYREYLPRIFTLDWMNPLLGRGVKHEFAVEFDGIYIHSIDNYYVSQYIKYAYPGLVTYIIFLIVTFGAMIRAIWKYRSAVAKLCFIATACYFYNLWWLDALQTLKYEYILVALFYGLILAREDEKKILLSEQREKEPGTLRGELFEGKDRL